MEVTDQPGGDELPICMFCLEPIPSLARHLLSSPLCLDSYMDIVESGRPIYVDGHKWTDARTFPGVDYISRSRGSIHVFVKHKEPWMADSDFIIWYERYMYKIEEKKWLYRSGGIITGLPCGT